MTDNIDKAQKRIYEMIDRWENPSGVLELTEALMMLEHVRDIQEDRKQRAKYTE